MCRIIVSWIAVVFLITPRRVTIPQSYEKYNDTFVFVINIFSPTIYLPLTGSSVKSISKLCIVIVDMCYLILLQYCVYGNSRRECALLMVPYLCAEIHCLRKVLCSVQNISHNYSFYGFKFISKQRSLPSVILSIDINKRTAVKIKSFRQDCNLHRLYFFRLRRNFLKASSLYFYVPTHVAGL